MLITTGSALAAGFVFLVATLPNVLFGPFAGTLVDRWEHKEVMIVSDLLRAAVILLIPIAVTINVLLVYPLVFTVTTISIFFRPARRDPPRIVDEEDLLTGNSALWIAEVAADVIGYPLAAVFVAALGTALPLAFWIDAATYLGSALLLTAVIVPPRVRSSGSTCLATSGRAERRLAVPAQRADALRQHDPGHDRPDHDRRHDRPVGRLRRAVLDGSFGFDFSAIYGFLETGIGLGNLIGGFVIGLIGARFAKGRMIIVGYAVMGLCVLLLAFASELPARSG